MCLLVPGGELVRLMLVQLFIGLTGSLVGAARVFWAAGLMAGAAANWCAVSRLPTGDELNLKHPEVMQ